MTLSELARSVGVWVEDVELLMERELLPPVIAHSFTTTHVAVLELIIRMRGHHRLSLDTIRAVLVREYNYDVSRAERALLAFVEPDPARAGAGPISRENLQVATGIEVTTFERLVDRGLLPHDGPYAGHHVWLCEALVSLQRDGLAVDTIEALLDISQEVGACEASVQSAGTNHERVVALSAARKRRRLVGDVLGRARYVGQRRRLGWLALAAGRAGTLASVRFYRPSPLFCVRHGADEWSFAPSDTDDPYRLGRLALGLGRLKDASLLLEAALRKRLEPSGMVAATLAIVRALQGDQTGSRNAVVTALEKGPEHSVVTAYSALSLAISAPSTTSSLQSAAWMELALELLERSRMGHCADDGERLEGALARGRLGLVVPSELNCGPAARDDLNHVLLQTRDTADQKTGQLERQILRINALYFLGMDRDDRGDFFGAKPLLAEVAWIDPTSEFARQSWLRLQKQRF
jgi:hypothetical protein